MDYKKYYQLFLKANAGIQHYVSHSHHYWPDVTRDAMIQYWEDSARLTDDKWSYFFSQKVPSVQRLISYNIKLSNPQNIVFAANTHEFVTRLISCFPVSKKIKILTTDSEFYSFDRQVNRLAQDQMIELCKIPTEPFISFEERFALEAQKQQYDIVFTSHVFFNSGYAIQNLTQFVRSLQTDAMIVIDAYHGFMALPTDISQISDRIFYIAGSYKYAQGGEGCCFMTIPSDSQLEPLNTGWFAGFGQLTENVNQVQYSNDGFRFAGSTMDYSALYRLEATLKLFESEGISVQQIHQHVESLQKKFLLELKSIQHPELNEHNILNIPEKTHSQVAGHFYTFALADAERSRILCEYMKKHQLRTDYRGNRLRFGFGLYQDEKINLECFKSN
jgi:selenocysteine lyase/cysteine desulfurase